MKENLRIASQRDWIVMSKMFWRGFNDALKRCFHERNRKDWLVRERILFFHDAASCSKSPLDSMPRYERQSWWVCITKRHIIHRSCKASSDAIAKLITHIAYSRLLSTQSVSLFTLQGKKFSQLKPNAKLVLSNKATSVCSHQLIACYRWSSFYLLTYLYGIVCEQRCRKTISATCNRKNLSHHSIVSLQCSENFWPHMYSW